MKQLLNLLENLPDGVALHDHNNIFYVNQATEKLLGIPRHEIKKKKLVEFLHPEDINAVSSRIQTLMISGNSGFSVPVQERLLRPDGNTVYVEISGNLIDYKGRPAGLIQLRDISKERLLLEAERTKKEEAEHSLKLRDKFISYASHELKTPLTALRLQVQTINKLLTGVTAPPPISKLLQGADDQITRLTKVIEQLLDKSKFL